MANVSLQAPVPSILELIGSTPMVEIRRLNPNPRVKILAKLEGMKVATLGDLLRVAKA